GNGFDKSPCFLYKKLKNENISRFRSCLSTHSPATTPHKYVCERYPWFHAKDLICRKIRESAPKIRDKVKFCRDALPHNAFIRRGYVTIDCSYTRRAWRECASHYH
ncbi:hypothetical protein, partial [Citrobacter werkmanii]|uniref:hypothetical protein n=1 Tax=Citrobacter werkmanii TaxID=67827 RepID=UPI001C2D600B